MANLADEYEVTVLMKNKRTGVTSWIKYLHAHNLGIDHRPDIEEGEDIPFGFGMYTRTAGRVKATDVTLDFRAQRYMIAMDIEKTPLDGEAVQKWKENEWQ